MRPRAAQDRVVAWLVVLASLALSPDLRSFVSVGHTPVYWPLLALLAWLVAARTLGRRRARHAVC